MQHPEKNIQTTFHPNILPSYTVLDLEKLPGTKSDRYNVELVIFEGSKFRIFTDTL